MGFFSFFRKETPPPSEVPIPENEKKFYQPDSYYVPVTTFEEWKKVTFPSRNGLYPAEIMLLEYCGAYGTYPLTNHSYPGLWWFQYGIRNVIAMLKSLEERGFLCYAPAKQHISRLKVAQLKELLAYFNLPVSGKKADLVERLQNNVADADLEAVVPDKKYMLTPLGEQELAENEYVPYMHAHRHTEVSVYDLNVLIHKNPSVPFRKLLWDEYTRLCLEHFHAGENGSGRNIMLAMARFLKEERQLEGALELFAQIVYIDLNREPLPFADPDHVLAPAILDDISRISEQIGCKGNRLIDYIEWCLGKIRPAYKNYTETEAATIITIYVSGHKDRAEQMIRQKWQ
ncbi:MAG: SAP domain-containing protein [Clostridiales bacterium]|nr:SAP domain-containing protein [Clostridiales bacterium]